MHLRGDDAYTVMVLPYLSGQADNLELKAEVICQQRRVLQPGNEAPMSAVDNAAHAARYVGSNKQATFTPDWDSKRALASSIRRSGGMGNSPGLGVPSSTAGESLDWTSADSTVVVSCAPLAALRRGCATMGAYVQNLTTRSLQTNVRPCVSSSSSNH